MFKATLYGAVAAGALAVATAVTPVSAAPVAKSAPDVQSNAANVQYYYYYDDGPRYRRHGWRHRHYHDPALGVYVNPGYYGPRAGVYVW